MRQEVDHRLKIWPEYFEGVVLRMKTFEVRKNDRGFKRGDLVLLEEFSPERGYTGKEILVRISFVLDDVPGIEKGYVVFAFEYA